MMTCLLAGIWQAFNRKSSICFSKIKPLRLSWCVHSLNENKYFTSYFHQNDTIYALSSGYGKCGVAVIRVSGPQTKNVVLQLTKRKDLPPPRKTFVSTLAHPKSNVLLDRALVVWFSNPNSFTGEDICEFQVHGGPAVISSVLNALSCFDGLRPAEAGDFTKRAFLNSKLDLTEVEGLGDLIHAETEAQRRQALHQMEGALSKIYSHWNKDILKCTAHIEAFIDFSEDEHFDEILVENVVSSLKKTKNDIEKHLQDKRRGEILRNGVRVAIIGQPNVGKSSLLNCIIRRPAAIVSPIAGTTRDVIESALDVEGFPILICDTAGLTKSDDIIEREGVSRAYERAEFADLILYVLDIQSLKSVTNFKTFLAEHLALIGVDEGILRRENMIVVLNKLDLISEKDLLHIEHAVDKYSPPTSFISCTTNDGLSDFMDSFTCKIKELCGGASLGEIPSVTQQRHRDHLISCVELLEKSLKFVGNDIVIAAEYLRLALNEIGKISGQVGAEEILDVIFKDFCIGK